MVQAPERRFVTEASVHEAVEDTLLDPVSPARVAIDGLLAPKLDKALTSTPIANTSALSLTANPKWIGA